MSIICIQLNVIVIKIQLIINITKETNNVMVLTASVNSAPLLTEEIEVIAENKITNIYQIICFLPFLLILCINYSIRFICINTIEYKIY